MNKLKIIKIKISQRYVCLQTKESRSQIFHQDYPNFDIDSFTIKTNQYLISFKTLNKIEIRSLVCRHTRVMIMDQFLLRLQTKYYFASLASKGKISAKEIEYGNQQKLSACLKAIGLLRTNWFNSRKEIITYSYGTAFAVGPNIIMTCLHNIYSQKWQKICDEVIFIPNISAEFIKDDIRKYRVARTQFIQYKLPSRTLLQFPLKEELVLMYLEENVNLDFFLKVGLLSNNSQYKDTKCLMIIGYPSCDMRKAKILSQAYPKRQIRKGKLHSIDNSIINYNINTQVGLSGSPVLYYNQMRQYVVVGIHTHRGREKEYNSGLFFNREILESVSNYEWNIYQQIKLENRIQVKIMQIIIYYYLLGYNLERKQTNKILPFETQKYKQSYYNFIKDECLQQEQYQRIQQIYQEMKAAILAHIQKQQRQQRSKVKDETHLDSLIDSQYQDNQSQNTSASSIQDDPYQNTSVLSIFDDLYQKTSVLSISDDSYQNTSVLSILDDKLDNQQELEQDDTMTRVSSHFLKQMVSQRFTSCL